MSKDKRKGWLLELVVGSEVIVVTMYGGRHIPSEPRKVTGISPTGIITVTHTTYDPENGHARGDSRYTANGGRIVQVGGEEHQRLVLSRSLDKDVDAVCTAARACRDGEKLRAALAVLKG